MNILLTGATGFLGNHLAKALHSKQDVYLTASARRYVKVECSVLAEVPSLDATTDWSGAVTNQDVIIHTAARAHIMKDHVADPLEEYRRVNVAGTLNLARQAIQAGVKRFIFISSIKVNGEQTPIGLPFNADDTPSPDDAYSISKWEAEKGLQQLSLDTGIEIVIIRPPLIYGPGVKGNFASIIKLVSMGLPLPLGAILNQRSLVGLDNMVDLIITCIDHPAAANQIFLAGDGHDLTTTDLLRGVARAMGKPLWLIPVPETLLVRGATLLGKKAVAKRLLGSLQVDISKARDLLGWEPPIPLEEGLRRCFQFQGK